MTKYPQVSIIFPNYNGGQQPLDCLTSIRKLNYPKEKIGVIVVDNNSKDGSDLAIKEKFPEVKLIKNKQNLGFAKAVNLAIKFTSSEYIFVTNNDVIFDKNCFANLVKFAKEHPEVGVTGPVVFPAKKNAKKKGKELPIKSLQYNLYTGLFKESEKAGETDWIAGVGMFFSKELWTKLGGLDEGFFFTFEDLDFCLRVKKSGLEVIHNPEAVIWHKGGSTVNMPHLRYFKYYQSYKSKFRFILKHGNLLQIISVFLLQFAVFTPYRFLILGEKSFVPMVDAFLWNLKNLPQTLAVRKTLYET